MFGYKTASVNHYYVKRSIVFRGLTISMTSEVEDKRISLTEVKPIKNGREKQGVKNVVKLNFFYLLLRNTFCMHTVSHRLITANLRTTPGRKNFKIVKQLSAGKKQRGKQNNGRSNH